ncbi:cell wall hydrolase [Virgibacillus sp. MSJ-26]|uniref:cell wall hydrolase n=1 Tax=Virgibacillus sp. MSJ-26 TaxID=2841522 RepID=UPI001C11B820|nr:cell wall hydrolase [Virgibacillus sp. MSJ-26]MBU5467153.1 cell wall hydrolase [Virgibacillus sp. MSJ-26]
MNRLKKLSFLFIFSISLFTLPLSTEAASYTVKKGDSLWSIANKFGTTIDNLHMANGRFIHTLYAGEAIQVPDTISKTEKELLAKLVHAEAKGEPYAGKVAVATVVLNRVKHEDFPNSIKGVIYEKVSGHYAFSPVKDGAINQEYNDEDMKAVSEAIAYKGQGNGSIYFYNPKTATSKWVSTRKVTTTIGNHVFAK